MSYRWIAPGLLFVLICGNIFADKPASPQARTATDPGSIQSETSSSARPIPIEDLYYTRYVSDANWSPDGRQATFTTNITGRSNIWKVDASGGWPIQLTQSEDRQYGAVWSPDGKWLLFQQDSGGNELWDIYAVPSDGGEVINLTQTAEVREENPRWSPDGKTVVVNYKPKDGNVYDLALIDWATRKLHKLTNESTSNYSWSSIDWSADGKTLFANREDISFTDSDVYSIDIASGQATPLTRHEGKILNSGSSVTPDGRTVLLTSTEKGGYHNVALLDAATGNKRWATDIQWESSSGNFSRDGKSFTYVINADGQQDAYIADTATLKAERIETPEGVNGFPTTGSPFSPTGGTLLISHASSVHPQDLYVYDTAGHRLRQLTFSAIASLKSAPLPSSHIVHYQSFDGKMISALMWIPYNLKRDGSNPALVLPHGGPTGQTQDFWSPRVAALVSHGYICIAPNVRGSTGYGIEFQNANHQDLGGGDLQDEVYAAKFLEATGYVNPKKIGITGGSYGGYMTLMAIGKTPNVWAAAVDLFGIINWFTMLQHEDAQLQQYEKSLLGDPEKDRAVYEAASPIKFIRSATAPLLVLQGDNDPRVPKEESQQVVDLLKAEGRTVEAHYYPDEGHGFAKRENQIDSIRRTLEWFDKYLR